MVEALSSKARAWETERGVEFSYDGVRLISMLEQYSILKQEKEQEHQRQRDQKKLQGQLIAEREVLFGSKPSPSKSGKKVSKTSTGSASNNRFSLGGVMLQTPNAEKTSLSSRAAKRSNSVKKHNLQNHDTSGFGVPSSGKRNIDITGIPVVQHSSNASNAHEIRPTPTRKPLSPVSSALSSKLNAANIQDQNITQNAAFQKTLPSNIIPVATPAKIIPAVDDENKTPRTTPIPMPTTPATVSVTMQTVKTPATPYVPYSAHEIEYSFEERRAGFVLPKTHPKPLLQV